MKVGVAGNGFPCNICFLSVLSGAFLWQKLLYLQNVVTRFFSPLHRHTISGEARHIDGEITKALCPLQHRSNILGNFDKYIVQFWQIYSAIGQIYSAAGTVQRCTNSGVLTYFEIILKQEVGLAERMKLGSLFQMFNLQIFENKLLLN